MNSRNLPVIAVTLDVDVRRNLEIFSGIEQAIREMRLNWRLAPLGPGFEQALLDLVRARAVDGVIGAFVSDAWSGELARSGVPAVNVSQISNVRAVPSVGVDFVTLGRRAGELLRATEPATCAFAGIRGQYASACLLEGLRASGLAVERAPTGPAHLWMEWLQEAVRPVSLFCANDALAREWVEVAREAGLRVPEDVAVLGVGDSPVDGLFAGVGLSTFALSWAEVGRTAALRLQADFELPIERRPVRPEPILLPPGECLQRASTRRGSQRDGLVEAVLETLQRSLAQPPSVDALARLAGVSRRTLELRFQSVRGQGPYQTFQQLRREHACRLLRERPDLRILDVARAVGFEEPHPFSAAFKKWTGLSPKQWRARHRDLPAARATVPAWTGGVTWPVGSQKSARVVGGRSNSAHCSSKVIPGVSPSTSR
ncbi:MAG: helix-turn-helix domain-containing protein [Opitutales bacterium]